MKGQFNKKEESNSIFMFFKLFFYLFKYYFFIPFLLMRNNLNQAYNLMNKSSLELTIVPAVHYFIIFCRYLIVIFIFIFLLLYPVVLIGIICFFLFIINRINTNLYVVSIAWAVGFWLVFPSICILLSMLTELLHLRVHTARNIGFLRYLLEKRHEKNK